ncbi:MAG TPA: hypothetical protein VF529_13075 [Solirubrobacteraceae bacterium]|jgi:hypothetical protein
MTENPRRLVAIRATGAIQVEHCDVPAEMTLDEWRRHCAAERSEAKLTRRGERRRALRRLLGA